MSELKAASLSTVTMPVSLYLHVPFCVRRCTYCSFHSTAVPRDPSVVTRFVEGVRDAAGQWAPFGLLDGVASVYVGGGTPTVLGDRLVEALDALLDRATLAPAAEVTVETNPETTTPGLLQRLRSRGVNRVSVGVQSLDEAVLGALGRRHTPAQAEEAVRHAKAVGASVSVDLMCGAPAQDLASWEATLERAVGLGVDHVSVYPLSVDEGTPLATALRRGDVVTPDDDATAEMMELAEGLLGTAGLRRYEVASYTRPGHECDHNVGYWTGRPYIGIGPSAASMLPLRERVLEALSRWDVTPGNAREAHTASAALTRPGDAVRVRFATSADTAAFAQRPTGPPAEVEWLTDAEAAAEDAMLGLRLTAGISDSLVDGVSGQQPFQRLAAAGLVEHVDGRWRTTRAGWLLGNEVFEAVWSARVHREVA